MTHAGGRPTKFTDEVILISKAYLDALDISTYTLLPTVEGLAVKLGISRDTIYEWSKENKEFSDITKDLKARQAEKLIQNALSGKYNAAIARLILSSKHGFVEQTATDITTNGNDIGVPVDAAQAEQLIRARAERIDI